MGMRNRSFRFIIESFLLIVENTAQIARIVRAIFKPNY